MKLSVFGLGGAWCVESQCALCGAGWLKLPCAVDMLWFLCRNKQYSLLFKNEVKLRAEAHIFNVSTLEAEVRASLRIPGHSGLHSEKNIVNIQSCSDPVGEGKIKK